MKWRAKQLRGTDQLLEHQIPREQSPRSRLQAEPQVKLVLVPSPSRGRSHPETDPLPAPAALSQPDDRMNQPLSDSARVVPAQLVKLTLCLNSSRVTDRQHSDSGLHPLSPADNSRGKKFKTPELVSAVLLDQAGGQPSRQSPEPGPQPETGSETRLLRQVMIFQIFQTFRVTYLVFLHLLGWLISTGVRKWRLNSMF